MQKRIEKYHTEQPGLIISYFGNSVAVETDDGQVFQCYLRRNQELPVVGDRVKWRLEKGDKGVVCSIAPRRSLLARGDGRGNMKPIAANIDVLVIVMAPPPIFSEYLIDRYLVAAELLNIQPIIDLNKIDLLNETQKEAILKRLTSYTKLSYPIIFTSIFNEETVHQLGQHLQGKTGVLVGPSGVGKSSLIAALGHHETIRIGEVTPKGAGKHTTTASRLYHLPQDGHLIDSPGVREFNLWSVSKPDILRGFKEFERLRHECKFRNCQHLVEPACAVQAAVANGMISA